MEHFTALLYIHSTNRCQLSYFKSDTCFIFLPILSTSTGICTDHTSIGSPLVSCVHTSYVTGFAKTVPIGTTIEIHFMA